jgi:uncharacterized membrane protein
MAESPKEREDRQLRELLEEHRVVMPGAQVLLGFMLTAPFASRFGRTTQFERAVLYACILSTATGALLLMGTSVYHRQRWQEGDKSRVVVIGHRLFLSGTFCLALGMSCAVFLVGDVLFGIYAAIAAIAVTSTVIVGVWYVLPAVRPR